MSLNTHSNLQINFTTDYNIFKSLIGNRGHLQLQEGHLLELEKSILKENLLNCRPIVVNENMVVIDGHHRLEVAKRNHLPIYYVIKAGADYKTAINLTFGTCNWTKTQYLDCYDLNNSEEHIKLKSFIEKYRPEFNIHRFGALVGGSCRNKGVLRVINNPNFKFDEKWLELEYYIKKILECTEILRDAKVATRIFCNNYFWNAMRKIIDDPEIEWNKFKCQLKCRYGELTSRNCESEYVQLLEYIYNKKNSKEKNKGKTK